MRSARIVEIASGRQTLELDVTRVLYVQMKRNDAFIHMADGERHDVRITLKELRRLLGDGFLLVHRSCLVSACAIHDITDTINLVNGEKLMYTRRRKRELREELQVLRSSIIKDLDHENAPASFEEYREHYAGFDTMPFAFTDIEMVFDEQKRAIDWVFRYGNDELARLEKVPLNQLIDHSFGSIFPNMDSKWLRCYERATLYGEKLELLDYSPEIDTFIKVICFPTFRGHCGCILFDIRDIHFTRSSPDVDRAAALYFGRTTDDTP